MVTLILTWEHGCCPANGDQGFFLNPSSSLIPHAGKAIPHFILLWDLPRFIQAEALGTEAKGSSSKIDKEVRNKCPYLMCLTPLHVVGREKVPLTTRPVYGHDIMAQEKITSALTDIQWGNNINQHPVYFSVHDCSAMAIQWCNSETDTQVCTPWQRISWKRLWGENFKSRTYSGTFYLKSRRKRILTLSMDFGPGQEAVAESNCPVS